MNRIGRRRGVLATLALMPLLLAAATACAGGSTGDASTLVGGNDPYSNLSPSDLARLIAEGETVVINVHVPLTRTIPETDLYIRYDEVETQRAQLPDDTAARIVVYCRSGRMSEISATALAQMGYTNVWTLEGGMGAWERSGLRLVDAPGGS